MPSCCLIARLWVQVSSYFGDDDFQNGDEPCDTQRSYVALWLPNWNWWYVHADTVRFVGKDGTVRISGKLPVVLCVNSLHIVHLSFLSGQFLSLHLMGTFLM